MTSGAVPTSVRLAVVLVHSIPGVRLQVRLRDGTTALVGAGCLGALTPCQFRHAVLDHERGRTLVGAIESVAVGGGLVDLGGGLYERGGGSAGPTERWFATTIAPDAVAEALTDAPPGVPADAFETLVRHDDELAAGTVRVRVARNAWRARLDDVAQWALARCLVAELLSEAVTAR